MQLKVYFDIAALQLLVSVVSATGLSPRADGSPRCPYAKIFLLPDKSEKSKRRTKTLANTLEPRWNQTFVYCGIRITDLKKRTLEVIDLSTLFYCCRVARALYPLSEFSTSIQTARNFGSWTIDIHSRELERNRLLIFFPNSS